MAKGSHAFPAPLILHDTRAPLPVENVSRCSNASPAIGRLSWLGVPVTGSTSETWLPRHAQGSGLPRRGLPAPRHLFGDDAAVVVECGGLGAVWSRRASSFNHHPDIPSCKCPAALNSFRA